jgi:hypothetical protein
MEAPPQIGRFRVLDLVGEGAMGVVFRGRDESLDRDVALKLMRARNADEEDKQRFLREARSVARLQHPNIITVYELGEHNGSPFIAMELLEGVDLQRAIEGGLRPNPRITLPIVLQLLAGLGHAHENAIVHRDVKPSNLFLPRGRPAKIMDFGVARLGGTTSATGVMVGTPNYMSPEQVKAMPVDGRSDLFSAALILYELVTGEKAYRGDSVVALVYQIAHEDPDLTLIPRGRQWERLSKVLHRGLAKDPDERYPTAEAMAADLALALQDLGGSIDGAAASDKGLVKRSKVGGAPTGRSPGTPRPGFATTAASPEAPTPPPSPAPALPIPAAAKAPPAAAPPRPPPRTGAAAVVAPPHRPAWLIPAVAGVVVLAGTAAALVVMVLFGPLRDEADVSDAPGPIASASMAAPLVSAAATLDSSAKGSRATPSPSPTPRPSEPARAVVTAAATSTPPPTEAPAPLPASARLDRASDLYERGRYAPALAEARAVLRREPLNREARTLVEDIEADMVVETRLKQARDALRRGDREAALAEVRAGLAVKNTDGRLLALFRELTQ